MNRFSISDTVLEGLKIIVRQRIGDTRGFLSRLFCPVELVGAGWCKPVMQINHTRTRKKGAIRGLHFQYPPHTEMKLVSCIRGVVWDVAVDLRAGSSTFLQWHAEELSADNNQAMLIPEGFAHGFQTLSENAELLYLHSSSYAPECEGAVNPQEPRLAIPWPLAITDISIRDSNHPLIGNNFRGIEL